MLLIDLVVVKCSTQQCWKVQLLRGFSWGIMHGISHDKWRRVYQPFLFYNVSNFALFYVGLKNNALLQRMETSLKQITS